jgi:hypothetical protein
MAELIDFATAVKVLSEPAKAERASVPVRDRKPEKTRESLQIRHNKAVAAIQYIQKLHFHKFSYPILASRCPKDTHSIDALWTHCFTCWGDILGDNELSYSNPGVPHAKRWAFERREEVECFLSWRIRQYEQLISLYGDDVPVIPNMIDTTKHMLASFHKLWVKIEGNV